jgi:hypothetical protein
MCPSGRLCGGLRRPNYFAAQAIRVFPWTRTRFIRCDIGCSSRRIARKVERQQEEDAARAKAAEEAKALAAKLAEEDRALFSIGRRCRRISIQGQDRMLVIGRGRCTFARQESIRGQCSLVARRVPRYSCLQKIFLSAAIGNFGWGRIQRGQTHHSGSIQVIRGQARLPMPAEG